MGDIGPGAAGPHDGYQTDDIGYLQGVKIVIAESYERIHRSNLIGMGILPLQFAEGESAAGLGLNGTEAFSVEISDDTAPQQIVPVLATSIDGTITRFNTLSRLDTPIEVQYYRDGGILRTVLKKLI